MVGETFESVGQICNADSPTERPLTAVVSSMRRAFSLLEVMVTISLLMIVAAIAVPSLLPQVQLAQLATSVDAVAAFAAAARDEAMLARRCTRIRMVAVDVLVVEMANSLSCEETEDAAVVAARRLEPTKPAWIEIRRLKLESPRLDASFLVTPAPLSMSPQLRFRPTGRVWTNDVRVQDDNVAIVLLHPVLNQTRHVVVMNNGFICTPPPVTISNATAPASYSCGST